MTERREVIQLGIKWPSDRNRVLLLIRVTKEATSSRKKETNNNIKKTFNTKVHVNPTESS